MSEPLPFQPIASTAVVPYNPAWSAAFEATAAEIAAAYDHFMTIAAWDDNSLLFSLTIDRPGFILVIIRLLA